MGLGLELVLALALRKLVVGFERQSGVASPAVGPVAGHPVIGPGVPVLELVLAE